MFPIIEKQRKINDNYVNVFYVRIFFVLFFSIYSIFNWIDDDGHFEKWKQNYWFWPFRFFFFDHHYILFRSYPSRFFFFLFTFTFDDFQFDLLLFCTQNPYTHMHRFAIANYQMEKKPGFKHHTEIIQDDDDDDFLLFIFVFE